ncbi:MAG: hypothetical protein E7322_10335 [Clostridiales bacterium]|nr:hypothetical protein [Clostridiales bacterium]
MKRKTCLMLVLCLALSLFSMGLAETYPVYEVVGRPAILYPISEWTKMDESIGGLEMHTKVIADLETGDMLLVSTADGICGWIMKDLLKFTGEYATVDYILNEDRISSREDVNISYITIDEKADLLTDYGVYPKTVYRGERTHDVDELLESLLGENYVQKPRSEWSNSTDYVSNADVEPWETKSVHVYDDGEIWYYDPSVSSERGGEYEPPMMNMLPEESVLIAKGLLSQYFTNGETTSVDKTRLIQERWSYADRWMTDEEYKKFMYNRDLHYFTFEHIAPSGLSILGDSIRASVGINGLNGFDLSWHNFTESAEIISPISLEEAVKMANSTRMAKATLLYADLVYSNWLTESDEYNLSWYLLTDQGSYVVDCVLLKHKCDSYEY